MKYHKVMRILLMLACVLVIQGKYASAQAKLAITHGPYLVDPAENAITVVWFTDEESLSWVEYCGDSDFGVFPTWGGYPQIANSSRSGLIDANTKRHAVRITNLDPGVKYRYRVASKEVLQYDPYEVLYGDTVVGEVLEFETLNPAAAEFSFGVVVDVHERAPVLDTLLQAVPLDAMDMIFFNGDILNWIGSEERIFNGFLDVSVKHFAREKPFVFIRGNHETRGPGARDLMSYFPHSSNRNYYSLEQGDVHFLILDSGEDKPDSHPVYAGLADFDHYRDEQAEWLKKEVLRDDFKQARYRIALFHIPLFSGSNRHGSQDITNKWGPILNEAGVDLVFNGHHHRYDRIEPVEGKNRFPIVIVGQDMIAETDVTSENLSIVIRNKDGSIADEFTIYPKRKGN